jgi:hypothetical protein
MQLDERERRQLPQAGSVERETAAAPELLPEQSELGLERATEQHTFHVRQDAMVDAKLAGIFGEEKCLRTGQVPDPFTGGRQVALALLIANDSIHTEAHRLIPCGYLE